MLQAIRSKATSLVVKILFAVLICTFAIWGIGDIFRNRSTGETWVAKVGGLQISGDQLTEAVRSDMERMRGVLGRPLSLDEAKQFGVLEASLQRLIEADLLQLEVQRLHLAVGDEAVRKAIVGNPGFRGAAGTFDRNVYNQVLAANRMSEGQYEALLRSELVRNELTISVTEGVTPPAELTNALYRAQAEHRIADIATLPASAAPNPPPPSEQDLSAFYDSHPDRFRVPERRDFTLAVLTIADVAAGIAVPDDRLKEEYQSRLGEFQKPEQRQLQQMLLPDEAKAKEAAARVAQGKDFAAVAKQLANADPSALDLGWVRREDLPAPLADAAFAAKPGGVTAPVQTSFGWHILRVVAVKPAETQSFDQVKNQLRQDVARDMAGDVIAKTANKIDDALAGGASLAEAAGQFGMKMTAYKGIDPQGHDAQDKPATLPKPTDTVLHTAFATDSGQSSALAELGDDGYFVVHVDQIAPAGVRPLAAAHDEAARLWQAEQRAQALGKLAESIVQEVNAGRALREVAAQHKLNVTTSPPLLRTGGGNVPPAIVAKIFGLTQGHAAAAPTGDSYAVAQLTQIQPADPAKAGAQIDQLSHQLAQQMQGEFLGRFNAALKRRYPVELNQGNLDRLF